MIASRWLVKLEQSIGNIGDLRRTSARIVVKKECGIVLAYVHTTPTSGGDQPSENEGHAWEGDLYIYQEKGFTLLEKLH